jgi:2-succinyl-5-enolpyruvyl-6-hydroxy-3-cyclohexene-1-carboxylate synthase
MSNPSTVYATTFVDELIRSGLKHVCVVPGSRHTPLILAFVRHQQHINIYSHLDERSASFFALGLALATDEPVALVCTSGTAGANFYPAIIEAHQSRVPLIVLTADRPHELRQSGANQTIDQVKMFGDFVLWFYDAPLPEDNPPDVALRNLRTLAARTYAICNGIRKGVVHINMPFRKPLEPDTITPFDESIQTPQTQITTARYLESAPDMARLRDVLDTYHHGVMICGGNIPQQLAGKLSLLSSRLGYPMFAESVSMVRYGEASQSALGGYDTYLDMATMPDVILRFGDVPISKALNDFIAQARPRYMIHVSQDGVWVDDSHLTTWQLHGDLVSITDTLLATITQRELPKPNSPYAMLEDTTWQVIDHEIATGDYFDGAVVYDVVDLIPDGSTLFAGNSLPVRHLDQFGKPNNKRIYTYANRGASGIDGNISTALGTGAGRPDNPLVAIVGDITFYHDMNGLLAVHRCGVPITVVLLNNDGGGIFHRLPIRKHDPAFTEYYVTAHGLDYSHTAKLYGLDYIRADTRDIFRRAFAESVTNRTSSIIEVRTDAQADLVRRNDVMSAVRARLQDLDLFR